MSDKPHINKLIRRLDEEKVLRRRNADLGWPNPNIEPIPVERAKALMSKGYRISKRDDKKRFGKSTGKRYYGHFSGDNGFCKHLPAKDLRERADYNDSKE